MSKPKTTNVYASTSDGLNDILGTAVADEPIPTARAAELVQEAQRVAIVNPLSGAPNGLPTLAGGGGGNDELVGIDPPGPTPRESAENLIELGFAVVPAEWQPENDAEREELVRAVERVFVYRGISPSLPPELVLLAVMGKYTRKRMAKPAVRSKVAPWLAKVPLLGKLLGAEPAAEETAGGGAGGQDGPFQSLPRMTPAE